ncbi:MAG: putative hydrolase of the HAD superfamily [Parcubacteria group bacterium Gr01-1014_29]|nr:MAG: putative hydrolase of the HAD superfamily [Parcubacteria group bacterium Gr01-1014_29]
MAKIKSKKVILFDLYQTLIDIDIGGENKKRNEAKGWEFFAKSLEQYGVYIAPAEFIALNDTRREDFYVGKDKKIHHHHFCTLVARILKDDLHIEFSHGEISSLVSKYHKIARGHVRLYPGVVEVLARLQKQYILSTASYTQGCYTQPELKELNIDQFFSYFIYTSDVGFQKASPEFYKQCLEIVGKKAGDCVMVGDNYDVDVLVPQKLGIKAVWVKNPVTANQYAHLFEQEPQGMVNLDEFDKLPEVIERVFS